MNPILNKQNDPEMIKLLEASTVAYTKAKYGEIRITYFLIFLAFAYPISYILIKNESFKLVLVICSFVLAIAIQLLTNTFKGNTSRGAIFKEEFDTKLFKLPWKSTIKKPDHFEVTKYSMAYSGNKIYNWYSTNISEQIPHNITIAILQHSNTSWDIALRLTYRKSLIWFLAIYTVVLWVFLISHNAEVKTIFSIHFSILSFYIHFYSLYNGNTAVIKKRKEISDYLDAIIRKIKYISLLELRDIQDEIYLSRQESAKVPNFFFRLYKKQMNSIAENYINSVNEIYNSRIQTQV